MFTAPVRFYSRLPAMRVAAILQIAASPPSCGVPRSRRHPRWLLPVPDRRGSLPLAAPYRVLNFLTAGLQAY